MSQDFQDSSQVKGASLPDKIDTRRVIEMIKNADLYDLINISLRTGEMSNESVEHFIQKALDKRSNDGCRRADQILQSKSQKLNNNTRILNNENSFGEIVCTPPSKINSKLIIAQSPSKRQFNDENSVSFTDDKMLLETPVQVYQKNNSIQQKHNSLAKPLQTSYLENSPQLNQEVANQYYQSQNYNKEEEEEQEQMTQNQTIKELQFDEEFESQEYSFKEQREQPPCPIQKPLSPYSESTYQSQMFDEHQSQIINDSYVDQPLNIETVADMVYHPYVLQPVQEVESTYNSQSFLKQRSNVASSCYSRRSPTNQSNYSSTTEQKEKSTHKFKPITSRDNQFDIGRKSQQPTNIKIPSEIFNTQCHTARTSIYNEHPSTHTPQTKYQQYSQNKTLARSVSTNVIKKVSDLSSRQLKFIQKQRDQSNTSRSPSQSFQSNLKKSHNSNIRPATTLTRAASQFIPQNSCKTQDIEQEVFQVPLTQRDLEKKSALQLANLLLKKGSNDIKKQKMMNSFSQMNIGVFIELERIKKPSALVYQTCKMFCQFANAFKEKNQEIDLSNWQKIQTFINTYITKYITEILTNIKNKVLSDLSSVKQQQKELLVQRLRDIKQEYFTGENLKLFKHIAGNKNTKTIVYFVFNVITYVLEGSLEIQSTLGQNLESQTFSNGLMTTTISDEMLVTQNSQDTFDHIFKQQQCKTFVLPEQKPDVYSSFTNLRSLTTRNNVTKDHNLDISPVPDYKSFVTQNDSSSIKHKFIKPTHQFLRRAGSPTQKQTDQYKSNKSPLRVDFKELKKGNNQSIMQSRSQLRQLEAAKAQEESKNLFSSRSPFKGFYHHQIVKQERANSKCSMDFNESSQTFSKVKQSQEHVQINDSMRSSQDNLDYKLMLENSNLAMLIREKAAEIEENMRPSSPNNKSKVDMSLIEEIKRRRLEQSRTRGDELQSARQSMTVTQQDKEE